MKIFAYVWRYARDKLSLFVRYVITAEVLWLLSMSSPFVIGRFVDILSSGGSLADVLPVIGVMSVIWTLQLAVTYISNIVYTEVYTKTAIDINLSMLEHIKSLPMKYLNTQDPAYLNQRINSDSSTVTAFALNNTIGLVNNVLTFVATVALVSSVNGYIVLIICLFLPLYVLVYLKFKGLIYALGKKTVEAQNDFFAKMNRQLSHIKVVKLNSWNELLAARLRESFESLFKTIMRNSRLSFLFGNIDLFIRYFINIVVFVFSAIEISNGRMTIGQFTMINSYGVILVSSVSSFLSFGKTYQNCMISYDRLDSLNKIDPEQNGSFIIDRIDSICVKDLTFSYSDNGESLLSNFAYSFTKRNLYAIAGHNGSGKSTFLDILTGLIQDYKGDVRINDMDIRDIDMAYARKNHMAFVEQEPYLFFDTLKENIAPDGNNVGLIGYWASQLNIHELIARVSHRELDDEQSVFSGGEKQKISQARAFVKDADLLIFDEPTSALDARSVGLFVDSLRELKEHKIILLVTHDGRLLDTADFVVNLSKSDVTTS